MDKRRQFSSAAGDGVPIRDEATSSLEAKINEEIIHEGRFGSYCGASVANIPYWKKGHSKGSLTVDPAQAGNGGLLEY